MITILQPRSLINNLWGKQKIKNDSNYRLMKYVLRLDYNDEVILHNVVTGHMVTLDNDEVELLGNLPVVYDSIMKSLVVDHFLVPEEYNEYKAVNQLRKILQCDSTGDAINHYTILPTTFCNARCFYCYESDYPHVQMSVETADKLIKYIDEHRKGKDVTINWFGGEPLVGIQRIDQISQGLKDLGITYSASMISNGYLFDEEIVERSVELWKLHRIQITLDGTEDTYNRVKAYVNIKDNPFQRVLKNIDLLSKKKVQVNIRLNMDFYNKDDILTLIDQLTERYNGNSYVSMYVNMLFNNEGFEPVRHSYDEILALSDIVDEYTERLNQVGLSTDSQKFLSLEYNHCMADNPHSILIQPDGSFCRCEHESILDNYGNIDEGILKPQILLGWKESDEPSIKCPECSLFPGCYHLRGCMNRDMPCTDVLQSKNINKQIERIRTLYNRKMEVMKNESI